MDEIEEENGEDLVSIISLDEEDVEELERRADNSNIRANEVVLNNMQRAVRDWRKCVSCDTKQGLKRPSKELRMYICKSKNVYIEKNDRVCEYHSEYEHWDEITCKKKSNFSARIIDEMLLLLSNPKTNECCKIQPDIGITNSNFKQLIAQLGIRGTASRIEKRRIESVRIYLDRLRHGHTFRQMAHRHCKTVKTISKYVNLGRKILLEHFVPRHIGYANVTREWFVQHGTDLSRILYCDGDPQKAVSIWDGTYIYTCGSSNYAHQRKCYSGQKHRRLFKIMKAVAADGTIIDVFGPFKANLNDAEIMKLIFNRTPIANIFKAGDVILVDRGFRDCVKFLERKGFTVGIPEFIRKKSNKQLTTMQGNKSRLVTKLRYVIEVANGRMKNKWQLFSKIIPSILATNLMVDYKIGAAILNTFAKPIISDKNDFLNVSAQMLGRVNSTNKLKSKVCSKSFRKYEKFFQLINSTEIRFPRLNLEDIKSFSCGTYSIREAISYVAFHKNEHNGNFEIFTFPRTLIWALLSELCRTEVVQQPMLIYAKLKSRFRSDRFHKVYILYESTLNDIREKFLFTCSCQHGLRTVGSCNHVMSVIWYLGYGRFQRDRDPASYLNDFFDGPIL